MASFKRSGLHRLECAAVACDGYVYATVAQLETLGFPRCACGAAFLPHRLELALLLGVDDCPAVHEYRAELERVAYGQMKQRGAGHNLRMLGRAAPDDPSVKAGERCEQRRAARAREARLAALVPPAEPMPF